MANRSDRRGEYADNKAGHFLAVAAIGAPRADFHHGPELKNAPAKGRRYDCSFDRFNWKIVLMHGTQKEGGREKTNGERSRN